MTVLQSALRLLYPDQCVACGAFVEGDAGLCGPCWRETPFVRGLACEFCGQPLMGDAGDGGATCDDCLDHPRPWARGRAAMVYDGSARRMVLALKHGDRIDLARPAARWLAQAGRELIADSDVIVPVPAHWWRLLARRYNQAAELARALGTVTGVAVLPDGLRRTRRTALQDGLSPDERFANLKGTMTAPADLTGLRVLLVDDVMTSGATLTAAAEACHAAGARQVSALVLARAVRKAYMTD